MNKPELLELTAAAASGSDGSVLCTIIVNFGEGPEEVPFLLTPTGTQGLSNEVRDAYEAYINTGGVLAASAPPTAAEVDEEKERRLAEGFFFQNKLYAYNSVVITDILLTALTALSVIVQGGEATASTFTTAHGEEVEMYPATVTEFAKVASRHVRDHERAAAQLKALSTIPSDYTSDNYWPQTTLSFNPIVQ